MTRIIPIRTGTIRLRERHLRPDMSHPLWRRRLGLLTAREWSEPMPIYTYLVEHAEGLILLDCGETARAGYLPWWHPFFRFAMDLAVEPGDEIGPQLRAMGIDPGRDLKTLVLSHLHHDHAGGLDHFAGTEIVVSDENYRASLGLPGLLAGAVPNRWPDWFDPQRRTLDGPAVAGFDATLPLTDDGSVFAVPTPGHMDGHLSLVVRTDEVSYLLAGDAAYDEPTFRRRVVEATAPDPGLSIDSMDRMEAFARSEPTVLLPAHDPAAPQRLAERRVLAEAD